MVRTVVDAGCEVCIHGLNHDGRLFSSPEVFEDRARRINDYLRMFDIKGFRSPVLYRKLEWLQKLDIEYDLSIPNSGRYDPQPGGCCTVFPFFNGNIVELPLTTVQDYTFFHILDSLSIDSWLSQMRAIGSSNGLITFNIHPDYTSEGKYYAVYLQLLLAIRKFMNNENSWHPLPGEAAAWWRQRDGMRLENIHGNWRIEGEGSERALLAFMKIENGTPVFNFARPEIVSVRRKERKPAAERTLREKEFRR